MLSKIFLYWFYVWQQCWKVLWIWNRNLCSFKCVDKKSMRQRMKTYCQWWGLFCLNIPKVNNALHLCLLDHTIKCIFPLTLICFVKPGIKICSILWTCWDASSDNLNGSWEINVCRISYLKFSMVQTTNKRSSIVNIEKFEVSKLRRGAVLENVWIIRSMVKVEQQ